MTENILMTAKRAAKFKAYLDAYIIFGTLNFRHIYVGFNCDKKKYCKCYN